MNRLLSNLLLCAGLTSICCVAYPEPAPKPEPPKQEPIVIKGVVYDEMTSAPIPDLKIFADSAGHLVTITNSKGEFDYPVPVGQDTVQILPYSEQIVGKSVYVSAEKFKNRTISIYAEHGMKVDVHVTDEQGKPVEKASILWMSAGGARAQTDKDGNAVLSGVSRFRNGYLSVEAPGYESYVENDVYAPLYAKGGFQITLTKPQESHGD